MREQEVAVDIWHVALQLLVTVIAELGVAPAQCTLSNLSGYL